MPILTIIDEQRAALEKVEALARLGLAAPEDAAQAFAAIAAVFTDAMSTVLDIVRSLD